MIFGKFKLILFYYFIESIILYISFLLFLFTIVVFICFVMLLVALFQIVLETEITNKAALHLYENLGFVRDKRLFRYYLNGVDALRLKLWCK